jgi:uncharacterized protein with HEPN domain
LKSAESVLSRILKHAAKIEQYTRTCSSESFFENDEKIDACVMHLSQIGELANQLDKNFENSHPEIPVRKLYGMRNRIVHDYEGINVKLVWQIIQKDIPDLTQKLSNLL